MFPQPVFLFLASRMPGRQAPLSSWQGDHGCMIASNMPGALVLVQLIGILLLSPIVHRLMRIPYCC